MKDGWLRAAMADDNMVAELLIRLRESDPHPSAFVRQAGAAVAALLASLPPFDWGTRQPRSKAAAAAAEAVPASASAGKKDRERTRRSPTTPLSWSACGVGSGCGGASPSDGYEDSSKPSDRFRSKGSAANETTTSTTGCKRPRKKKQTFAELKEEESCLLKERTHLNKELDSLRIRLEDQRSLNVNLKRIKLDLHVKSVPTLNMLEKQEDQKNQRQMEVSNSGAAPWNSLKEAKFEHVSDSHDSCPTQNQSSNEETAFVLPDLNMMPEEDCAPGKGVRMS